MALTAASARLAPGSPLLGLRGVSVERSGRVALRVEALDVFPDEVLAVVGPNGAGKSTLLETLALVRRPVAGRVLAFGRDLGAVPAPLALRRRVVFGVQSSILFRGTVRENVGLGLTLRGVRSDEKRRRVDEALGWFGVGHLAGRPAHALSGGEARRVTLARALAVHPDVLLLDEPFSGLDPATRESLIGDAGRVLRAVARSVVLVTHDRTEALALADRVAVLDAGRIVQIGRPDELLQAPANGLVRALVGGSRPSDAQIVEAGPDYLVVRMGDRVRRIDLTD